MIVQEIAAERVGAELERVLARAEFHESKSLLSQMLEELLPLLDRQDALMLGHVLRWVLIAALAVLAFVLLRRLFLSSGAPRRAERDEVPPAPAGLSQRLAELEAQARAARARGDLRLALRLLYFALVLALGGRGDLEYRDSWTQRELLRRGKPSAGARALLEALLRELEPKEFGPALVSEADVERLQVLLTRQRGARAAGGAA